MSPSRVIGGLAASLAVVWLIFGMNAYRAPDTSNNVISSREAEQLGWPQAFMGSISLVDYYPRASAWERLKRSFHRMAEASHDE